MGSTKVRLIRRKDWEQQLVAFMAANKATPFSWGSHDCCLFACDCIRALTGVDPAVSLRGYRDKRGAVKALREFTGQGLEAAMERIACELCAEEVAAAFARRGDAAYVRQDNGLGSFGIVMGETVAVAGFPSGVAMLPRVMVVRTWRVG